MKVDWTTLKNFVDSRSLSIQYVDFGNFYWLKAIDGPFALECELDKSPSDTTDLDDFTTNYLPVGNKSQWVQRLSGVPEPINLRARLVGAFSATITAGSTTNIDWVIPQVSWQGNNHQTYFDGIEYLCDGAVGDTAKFQVVDSVGNLLEEFGTDVYVFPNERVPIRLYKAKLVPGLKLRIVYTSTGTSNVRFVGNLYRHLNEKVII